MLDPRNDMLPPPSSPTNSSISSSDLDTEKHNIRHSNGCHIPCHHFQSTFPATHPTAASSAIDNVVNGGSPGRSTMKEKEPGGFCRWRSGGEGGGGACAEMEVGQAASLREFLEVERRFGDAALEIEGVMVAEHPRNGGVMDGCCLRWRFCTADAVDDGNSSSSAGALWRFPVSLTGICSGGSDNT
uniref:Uncharacterized protein n=1 Tax=Salix viminalis TaxID=40686 RepID=A0A6N2N2G6_SALVM